MHALEQAIRKWVEDNAAACIRARDGDVAAVGTRASHDLTESGVLPYRMPYGGREVAAVEFKIAEAHDEFTFEVEYTTRPIDVPLH